MRSELAPIILTDTESILTGSHKSLNFVLDGRFYIYGIFDETIGTEIVPVLIQEIETKKKQRDAKIAFFIDSDGGNGHELMKLLTLVEVAKKHGIIVETYVFAKAYSCGSLLACAGTKGHRYVGEYAEHCCHLGKSGTGFVGNDVELERSSARAKSHFELVRTVYRKYARIKNLEKIIHDDSFFIRGPDILLNGLADQII